jgi:hypothetical protein
MAIDRNPQAKAHEGGREAQDDKRNAEAREGRQPEVAVDSPKEDTTTCGFHLFVGSASRRAPQVFMMQSTDARHLHHPPLARQLHTARLGCVFSQ